MCPARLNKNTISAKRFNIRVNHMKKIEVFGFFFSSPEQFVKQTHPRTLERLETLRLLCINQLLMNSGLAGDFLPGQVIPLHKFSSLQSRW